MKVYEPKIYQKDIYSINYQKLFNKNIKYLVFDLDNTLGRIDEVVCSQEVKNFVNELSKNFTIIVASNNNQDRVNKFCSELNADTISFSLKPSSRIYFYIKNKYTSNMNEVCVIGDQLVTDIVMGNRFNMLTILVDPIASKDLAVTSLNRFIEKKLMEKINFKKGEYYEEK